MGTLTPIDPRKIQRVAIRVSEEEKASLQRAARARANMGVSQYLLLLHHEHLQREAHTDAT